MKRIIILGIFNIIIFLKKDSFKEREKNHTWHEIFIEDT